MCENTGDDLLCPTTLAALNEFLREKAERENQLKHVLGNQNLDISFDENWVSQFLLNKLFYFIYILYIYIL